MNTINEIIAPIFSEKKIEYFGTLPFDECRMINRPLYDRAVGFTPTCAVMFLVPYYSGEHKNRNVSLYSVPRDYHIFFRSLFDDICPLLREKTGFSFTGFADHSPIAETEAALKCGLGSCGEKGQLINRKYGSHVFIGEILTDYPDFSSALTEISHCIKCGKCISACPSPNECFSGLNQKKGELDEKTKALIVQTNCAWGCDICRSVCPMNENISETPFDFFRSELLEAPTCAQIEAMSKEEFSERAYSFRGKNTIMRNILYLEQNKTH